MNPAALLLGIAVVGVTAWIIAIATRKSFLQPGDRIWVLGDSLGVGLLHPLIENGKEAGIPVAGDPKGGTIVRQWSQKSDLLAGPKAHGATVALVILGSNDANANDDYITKELAPNVQLLAGELKQAGMRVVWLIPGAPPGLPKSGKVNEIIESEGYADGFMILDPSDLPVSYQPYDGIHPTPAGYNALADWIFDKLSR
jgi:lysophospholipase L1-like esterase